MFLPCPFFGLRRIKNKIQNKTTTKKKRNKTKRSKQQNHLVLLQKKEKQTAQTQQKKHKQENKHETEQTDYLVTNMTKNTSIARKTMFFIVWKQNKKQNKNKQ